MASNTRSVRIEITLHEQQCNLGVRVVLDGPHSLSIPLQVGNTSLLDLPNAGVEIMQAGERRGVVITRDVLPGLGEAHVLASPTAADSPWEVSYAAAITDSFAPRRRGPSYDLRGADGRFAAALFGFIPLPWQTDEVLRFEVEWRLSEGMEAVSTLGDGDVSFVGTTAEFGLAFVLGGSISSYESSGGGVSAAWWGEAAYDPVRTYEFSEMVLDELSNTFEVESRRPYRIFVRPGPNPRDAGAATANGFILEGGRLSPTEEARMFMFAHEISHHFAGTLEGEQTKNGWYSEGLAEYYKIEIARRVGAIGIDELVTEIRTMTRSYYESVINTCSVDDLKETYWTDAAVQMLAYNRGFMYFTDLADLLRRNTDLVLDDLIRRMNDLRVLAGGVDEDDWRAVLWEALGERGVEHLDSMLAGALIVPDADAFGTDLVRYEQRIVRRHLGFDDMSLTPLPGQVRGLALGSAAHAAGLREGDVIVGHRGVTASPLHSSRAQIPEDRVELSVERGDHRLTVGFDTRVDVCQEYYWEARK